MRWYVVSRDPPPRLRSATHSTVMPPKGTTKKKAPPPPPAPGTDGSVHTLTLAEQLNFLYLPRPFKSTTYAKNPTRRTKNLKAVLGQERERERTERERRRVAREQRLSSAAMDMDVDLDVDGGGRGGGGEGDGEDDLEDVPTYTSIEAPPSVLPPRHYCDITGLDAPYTDPRTGLRYHDKSVYDLIKHLSPGVAKDYLSARGVNPIVR